MVGFYCIYIYAWIMYTLPPVAGELSLTALVVTTTSNSWS